jgi:hypothetical protein
MVALGAGVAPPPPAEAAGLGEAAPGADDWPPAGEETDAAAQPPLNAATATQPSKAVAS